MTIKKFVDEHKYELAVTGYFIGGIAICVAIEKLKGPRLRRFKPTIVGTGTDEHGIIITVLDKKLNKEKSVILEPDNAIDFAEEVLENVEKYKNLIS